MSISETGTSSYSERCKMFFADNHEWNAIPGGPLTRVVAWDQFPHKYLLSEYGTEVETEDSPRLARIQHKMYQLAMVSPTEGLDTLQNFQFWYAIQPPEAEHEHIVYMNHVVDPRAKQTALSNEIKNDMLFMIDNDLCVPNDEELLQFSEALELGYLDGYKQCPPKK